MLALFCGSIGVITAAGGDTVTALEAIALLPAEMQKQVSLVEAREGTPDPVRWYIDVVDTSEPNGLREYVTSGSTIVASRSVSQFSPSLGPQDILGMASVKFDSSYAANITKSYADAGKLKFSKLNYELRKGDDGLPRWTVACLDDDGNAVGEIILNASQGSVVSHSGFAALPENSGQTPRKKKALAFKHAVPSPAPVAELAPLSPSAVAGSTPRGSVFQKVGNTVGKLFGRKDQ